MQRSTLTSNRPTRLLLITAIALGATACGTDDAGGSLRSAGDDAVALPDGWFDMAGYGTVLHVDGAEITAHHVTPSTCAVGDRFDNALVVDHASIDAGVIEIDLVGPTTDYRLVPLAAPLDCASRADDASIALDEVFTTHYPFFAERGMDWSAAVDALRAAVDDDPSAFEPALADLMVELADGHTTLDWLSIDPEIERFAMPELTTIDDTAEAVQAELDATLERVAGLRGDPTGAVGWGTLRESVGYLLLAGFDGASDEDDPVEAREALAAAMDAAIGDLSERVDRLVVDIRFNEGGYEDLAVMAAGYFVDEPTPAYRKWARAEPDASVQEIVIEPQSGRFDGEVVVLTSPITASAAEIFALSMAEVADATVVGNRSFGEFSDAIDWVLPNGIAFTLSMEVYTDLDGANHEAEGVPVDVETRFDRGVDVAVEMLG